MNMIERIATIVERSLERHGVENYRGTVDDAKDILEAMKEPTDKMQDAGVSTWADVGTVYSAMISAALKEE